MILTVSDMPKEPQILFTGMESCLMVCRPHLGDETVMLVFYVKPARADVGASLMHRGDVGTGL